MSRDQEKQSPHKLGETKTRWNPSKAQVRPAKDNSTQIDSNAARTWIARTPAEIKRVMDMKNVVDRIESRY